MNSTVILIIVILAIAAVVILLLRRTMKSVGKNMDEVIRDEPSEDTEPEVKVKAHYIDSSSFSTSTVSSDTEANEFIDNVDLSKGSYDKTMLTFRLMNGTVRISPSGLVYVKASKKKESKYKLSKDNSYKILFHYSTKHGENISYHSAKKLIENRK